jgi:hypothetical protein
MSGWLSSYPRKEGIIPFLEDPFENIFSNL